MEEIAISKGELFFSTRFGWSILDGLKQGDRSMRYQFFTEKGSYFSVNTSGKADKRYRYPIVFPEEKWLLLPKLENSINHLTQLLTLRPLNTQCKVGDPLWSTIYGEVFIREFIGEPYPAGKVLIEVKPNHLTKINLNGKYNLLDAYSTFFPLKLIKTHKPFLIREIGNISNFKFKLDSYENN